MRKHLLAALIAACTIVPSIAHAEASLPKELDGLAEWLASKSKPTCSNHCFVLDELELTGDGSTGRLQFVLRGGVLAETAVDVPLFGRPDDVRLEDVKEDGKAPLIGFDADHYYLHTSSKRFVLQGTLVVGTSRALTIVGPLNTLHGKLEKGRIVEGASLSGLLSRTLHVDDGAPPKPAEPTAGPPVFEMSRVLRVGREIGFEYRLSLRAGAELGVVKLPLSLGERVVDVSGATGWKVEGSELTIPTSGRTASVTITGTIAELSDKKLTPDPRAVAETWMIEPDAEHRINVGGDGKRLDASQAPVSVSSSAAQVWLLPRGKHLELATSALVTLPALAATLHTHQATVVLGDRGDVVLDETLVYDARGVDFTALSTKGTPVFVATDGMADRLLRDPSAPTQLQVPLRDGTHVARVQTLGTASIGTFGGQLAVMLDTPTMPVTHASVRVGLPERMHAIALLGGDRLRVLIDPARAGIAALGALLGALMFSSKRERVLGAIGALGFAILLPTAFTALTIATLVGMVGWAAYRKVSSTNGKRALLAGAVGVPLLLFMAMFAVRADKSAYSVGAVTETAAAPSASAPADVRAASRADRDESKPEEKNLEDGKDLKKGKVALNAQLEAADRVLGGNMGGESGLAMINGVKSVAMSLPTANEWVALDAELVTAERPFQPRILYVTDALIRPLVGLWALCLLALAWSKRNAIRQRLAQLRELATTPTPKPEPTPAE